MSECRCADIQDTENKIGKLESASEIANGYGIRKENRDRMLVRCSLCAQDATQSSKVSTYCSTFGSLGSEMDQASGGISGKINDKLAELGKNLVSMRQEDEDYHEQERLEAEQAEREAAEKAAKEKAAKEKVAKNSCI